MPTWSRRRSVSVSAAAPPRQRCSFSASPSWRPMRCTGLRQLDGSWKIMAMRLPRTPSSRRAGAPISCWPSRRTEPPMRARAGRRPRAASQVTLLPEPDSPTMPSASPGAIERSTPSTARERPSIAKSTVSAAISTKGAVIATSVGGEVDGAELHREGRRGLPADVLALGGEGRVLVQHGVGGILALADFQHALEHRLALLHVGLDLHGGGELVHLLVGPFADLLLLALRTVLGDDRGDRVVEARAVGPVAHGALAVALEDLLPVLLHLDRHVEPDLAPHLDQHLRRRHLVGVVVAEQAIGDRLALVVGVLQELPGLRRVVGRDCPVLDEHRAIEFPLQTGRHAGAVRPQRLDDGLAVDGMAEGLADARIDEPRMV